MAIDKAGNAAARMADDTARVALGEEVRRHLGAPGGGRAEPAVGSSPPLRGGQTPDNTAADRFAAETAGAGAAGDRALYLLTHRGSGTVETPVFAAGETGALAVFTDRNKAILYIQVAGWLQEYEPAHVPVPEFARWLERARAEGVGVVAVDPDRRKQRGNEPQPARKLDDLAGRSDENLFRELQDLAAPRPVSA